MPKSGRRFFPWLVAALMAGTLGGCGGDDSEQDAAGGHAGHGAPQAGTGEVASDGYIMVAKQPVLGTGAQRFRFSIKTEDERTVRDFEVEHEKRMHLIVVSRDLSSYQHVHPRLDSDGVWSVQLDMPDAGVYRAFADFHIGRKRVLGTDLFVPGDMEFQPLPRPDTSVRVGDYQVLLSETSARAKESAQVSFTVLRKGRPVADLQPYLGARGHLVALRAGDLSYLHVHPEDGQRSDGIVPFAATFPSVGRYRLFMQFRHRGRVRTAPFTVVVGAGSGRAAPAEPDRGGGHEAH